MVERKRFYAGVGSRSTPSRIIDSFVRLARRLADVGYVLRSGGAEGADSAFESGCDKSEFGQSEIFLPWQDFNGKHMTQGDHRKLILVMALTPKHEELIRTTHPCSHGLSEKAWKLHGRNCHQILGPKLDDPVDFVVCWTPDGAECDEETSRETGGTGTAIRLASMYKIPVFNAGKKTTPLKIKALIDALERSYSQDEVCELQG